MPSMTTYHLYFQRPTLMLIHTQLLYAFPIRFAPPSNTLPPPPPLLDTMPNSTTFLHCARYRRDGVLESLEKQVTAGVDADTSMFFLMAAAIYLHENVCSAERDEIPVARGNAVCAPPGTHTCQSIYIDC